MKKEDLKIQNRHLLWLLMDFSIARYLLSNTQGRLNGHEKAEQHLKLSSIFLASKMLCSLNAAEHNENLMRIHDATRKLTDYMDKEIGFPISEEEYDINELSRKFFDRFIELAEEEWRKIVL